MVYILLFLLFAILFVFYMWRTANQNKVYYKEFSFEQFPSSFGELKVFFISDIHKRLVSDKIIDEVKGKMDIIIIGGDLTEKGVPQKRVEENIRKLKSLGPTYFVWGNNDYEGDYHWLDATLLQYGIKILDNTSVIFESEKGDVISLVGIDYLGFQKDKLPLALSDSIEGSFRILVSHHPGIIKKIKESDNIPLILSGHTHGGQIRFLGFGPYEKGGIKKQGNSLLFTSNGYGTSLVPLRLGAKPETHLITIKHKNVG
ncbi:metallophosphoesterase [Peribacillus alkalitolerans]|uniref:metallophosphoesterase n=1 Tax=Peribacillus alkalitolerans TaxID=1550385 RepID=UPI0013D672E9|nr:metallophosphoesterase [Peribacillus alkalitolerans]